MGMKTHTFLKEFLNQVDIQLTYQNIIDPNTGKLIFFISFHISGFDRKVKQQKEYSQSEIFFGFSPLKYCTCLKELV